VANIHCTGQKEYPFIILLFQFDYHCHLIPIISFRVDFRALTFCSVICLQHTAGAILIAEIKQHKGVSLLIAAMSGRNNGAKWHYEYDRNLSPGKVFSNRKQAKECALKQFIWVK
jgi:hypothetical protein